MSSSHQASSTFTDRPEAGDIQPLRIHSTQNLIVNGGFSRELADGWTIAATSAVAPAWRRIAVPDFDQNGRPRSAYALSWDSPIDTAAIGLSQDVPVQDVPARQFALRVTARGSGPISDAALCIAVFDANARDRKQALGRFPLRLSPRWQRYRVQFEIPAAVLRPVIEIVLYGPERPGSPVALTDVHLVGLLRPFDDISIRFDTCDDIVRPSSRLRAFLIEDYLHLLGCRTSLNQGRDFDLRVCQKKQPWLAFAMARLTGKTILFDLDDNDLLISATYALNVRAFARMADEISVGSEFLQDMARHWNTRNFLLENPVDVLDPDIRRDDRPWADRLVWFGMPENCWMLDRLDFDRPVTAITRGGDIEYGIKTIDRDLVSFDLALLPVVLNEETRAKNANRLVKCVALGLPFLARDTAEHRRAIAALQLPDDFLVASDDHWNTQIAEVAQLYPHYRRLMAAARPRAYDVYGVERIAADWMEFCAMLSRVKATPSRGR